VSLKSALGLCPRGRVTLLGWVAGLAVALWGLAGPGLALAQQTPLSLRGPGGETNIVADRMQQVGGDSDLLLATGNVEILRGGSRLVADRVEINRATGEAVAQGKAVFFDGEDRLVGDRIDFNLNTGTGVVYKGSTFVPPYYRLSADRMDRLGEGVYSIRQGIFTTCEGDDPAWSFRLGSARADLEDLLTGTDATFLVKGVPIIPVPFFAASIRRERQSGFLFPEFGSNSRYGFLMRQPYYWAINDSQDLTFALDVYTQRGVGADLDYRYILSRDTRGQLTAFGFNESFLTSAQSKGLPENRGYVKFEHLWQATPSLSFKLNSNVTSDDTIYRTYASTTADRVRQVAETNAFVTQRWDAVTLVGRVYWYQDLTQSRAVELQRAPEIKLTSLRQPLPGVPGLLYEGQASFVNFVREVGSSGVRADFHPRLYMPVSVAGLFTVTPYAGGRLTFYNKEAVGQDFSPGPAILGDPVSIEKTKNTNRLRQQIEGGMLVEARASRVFTLDGTSGISALEHIIEPRANFIEIRGINQKANPQWEPGGGPTSRIDPGYEARTGIDAINKANEVTYSLTNRLNAKTTAGPNEQPIRWEMARMTLSQTFNFLPVGTPFKDLVAEALFQPNEHLRFRADARYNVYDLGLRDANAEIAAVFRDFSVNVGPRFNEQQGFRFIEAGGTARLSRFVDSKVSSAWDVTNGRATEARGGLNIHFDCWAITTEYVHRYGQDSEFRFSVNLLGLGQTSTSAKGLGF
jgi:LPS-assembly protein